MPLSTSLADDFTPSVRHRGETYYRQGLVRIRRGSATEVEAQVRGSRNYEVVLEYYDDGVFTAWCDCPFYDTDGPCKHIWATILAAEYRGYLSAAFLTPDLQREYNEFAHGEPSPEPLPAPKPPPPPRWKQQLAEIHQRGTRAPAQPWPAKREILYVVEVPASKYAGSLVLQLASHDRKKDGSWGQTVALSLKRGQIAQLPIEDREIISSMLGGSDQRLYDYGYGDSTPVPHTLHLQPPLSLKMVQAAAATGRLYWSSQYTLDVLSPLAWDDGEPWQFALEMRRGRRDGWQVAGLLLRGDERLDLESTALVTPGLVFTGTHCGRLADDARFDWIEFLRKNGAIAASPEEGHDLLASLLGSPGIPPLDVPAELRFEEITAVPRPHFRITGTNQHLPNRLKAQLAFDYDGKLIPAIDTASGHYDPENRRFLRRDAEAEKSAVGVLADLGVKYQESMYSQPGWDLAAAKLPRVVRDLVERGWHIEAEGKIFRRPGAFKMGVASGVDWFELHAEVDYGGATAKLPALLDAMRRGDTMVRLGDGTYGVLPEEWLQRFGMIAGMGDSDTDHVRFRRTQAGLLDALLAAQPEATFDETFARIRGELRDFRGVEAAVQPAGFCGHLRDYQREGLGWMQFLQRFSFGGCLADDMGVGKTAQVLALLETRREAQAGPSLVVVPKSLVFNWKQEAARFTPQLRVLDYTGAARATDFDGYHIVLSTYGTIRRDILRLKDIEFDYIVLDEAQAVKNAASESAKAVRLLRGSHRLALSGTPVENHLGELWSLFEFLNPGMLGTSSAFKLSGGGLRNPDEDTRKLLAHALRPFILRRTKEQVAKELPPKTEQTLLCEMETAQRKLYNELRQHYRNALLKRIETDGLAKSKIQVLEALLRLRQAACHPGLLDSKRTSEPSAKLDTLLHQVREVLDEGHKALVFSQFTSLLSIVRTRLDTYGITYEYLDGATTDRQSCVERFQNDPGCRLFLLSLKAGGLGLNLTAAEYVFLLDPWWNPAVEAQAMDRAHRIGQTRQVFAYRLIAKDTVEEKVLELQKTKRDLAAAIISADNSLIRDLKREDLELLLS
jgi:superfamily II DNA or RNA helicase